MYDGKVNHGARLRILALLFVLQASASLVTLSFGPLALFLQEDLNITRAQVGLFTSMVFAGSLFFGIICGWLIDRFNVRRFLLLGPLILGVFFIALTRTSSLGIALALTLIGGVGYVFVNPCAAKALTTWFSPGTRATSIGIMKSGVALGGALGAAGLPGLSLLLGWRNALVIVAAAAIMVAVIVVTLYHEASIETSVESSAFGLKGLRRVFSNSNVLLIGGMGLAYSAMQLSLSSYLVLFLQEAIHLPVVIAGTYLTVALVRGAVARVLWGVISDRVFGGQRKLALVIAGLINVTMAILLAFLAAMMPPWLLYVVIAIFGFAAFGWVGLYITFLAELGGKEGAATVVGFGMTCGSVDILLGPPSFGHIVDITNSYTVVWMTFGIITAVGCALILLVRESRKDAA